MNNINNKNIDVLNRDDTINRIFNIIKNSSENKSFVSFAIKGEQGVGKSYIVNKLIDKIKSDTDSIVIKYDCWKNDYYTEPLKAILLNIADEISNSIQKTNEKINEAINIVVNDVKTVIDKYLTDHKIVIYSLIRYFCLLGNRINRNSLKNASHETFDENNDLEIILDRTREGLKKLSHEKTLIIFVDELDRCVPEYAIKVLERTHHVYNDINNLIIIYVYDEDLLINSVKKMFGDRISIDKYLRKFINYSLQIDTGECCTEIFNKYSSFFNISKLTSNDKKFISNFITNSKVNIRDINKMIDNLNVINKIIALKQEHPNYTPVIQTEIVIYIAKLIFREYFMTTINHSLAYQTKNFVSDIVLSKETDFNQVFPKELITGAINIFSKIQEYYTGNDIVHTFNDDQNYNLLDCKYILDQLYECGKYKYSQNISIDTINLCKEIKKYIEMFTISN